MASLSFILSNAKPLIIKANYLGDLNSRIGDFSPKRPLKKAVTLQHKIEQFNRSNQANYLGDLNSRIGDFSPKRPLKKAVTLQHKTLRIWTIFLKN